MSTTATEQVFEKYSLRAPREYKNYVNGEWVASKSGKTFDDVNQANSDKTGAEAGCPNPPPPAP